MYPLCLTAINDTLFEIYQNDFFFNLVMNNFPKMFERAYLVLYLVSTVTKEDMETIQTIFEQTAVYSEFCVAKCMNQWLRRTGPLITKQTPC